MIQNIFQTLTDSYSPAIILPKSQTKIHYSALRHSIQFLSNHKPFINLNPGEIISFSMPSSVEFILTFFCIASVNAVANPMVTTWNLSETVSHFQVIKPRAVICVKGCSNLETLKAACSQLNIPLFAFSLDLTFQTIQVPRAVRRIAVRVNTQLSNVKPIANIYSIGIDSPLDKNDSIVSSKEKQPNSIMDIAIILSTHSTTGCSKLVPISHGAILKNIDNMAKLFDLGPSDCTVLLLPLYHSHGLIGVLLSTFLAGGTVILENEFTYNTFWKDASLYQSTWFTATPWMHRQILKARKTGPKSMKFSLKFVQSTGAPLEENLLLDMERAYHAQIVTSYSMTEAAHLISSNIPNRTRKLGSVGSPVSSISCILVNEKNEKITTGIGEICICGPTVFPGYFGKGKDETFISIGKDTFFKTGNDLLIKAI